MEPLCVYEYRKCVNHGFEDWPVIEIVRPEANFEKNVTHLMVLYVMEGGIGISFGKEDDYSLVKGDLMLFPPGTKISVRTTERTPALMLLKIKNRILLCDQYLFGDLSRNIDIPNLRHTHLRANRMVRKQMELLADNVTGRLRCYRFMELKIVELFHYLRAYYHPGELAGFSMPLMSPNARFMHFIWSNYRKVRNVIEFARMANCSLSAFKVKFKNVTGMPPSQWLSEQKARNVYHEISSGEKSLKEIGEEYHFSSVSHLGTFCKKNFGQSPGTLKPGRKTAEKSSAR